MVGPLRAYGKMLSDLAEPINGCHSGAENPRLETESYIYSAHGPQLYGLPSPPPILVTPGQNRLACEARQYDSSPIGDRCTAMCDKSHHAPIHLAGCDGNFTSQLWKAYLPPFPLSQRHDPSDRVFFVIPVDVDDLTRSFADCYRKESPTQIETWG